MILTREQVEELDLKAAETALKRLHKNYQIDTPVNKIDYETWLNFDDVCNTLLWLEDRIKYIKMTDHLDTIRH
jgi:hypothetical protein